jgi:hypothetical protein
MRAWLAQELPGDVAGAGVSQAVRAAADAELERTLALLSRPPADAHVVADVAEAASDAAATAAMGGDWDSAVAYLRRITPARAEVAKRTGAAASSPAPAGAERWDAEHVWRALAGTSDDPLGSVAVGLGLTRAAALEHVHALVEREQRSTRPSWIVRHWLDAALVLGLAAVAALSVVDVQRARARPAEHQLRAERALPAYHVLVPGAVRAVGPDPAVRRSLLRSADQRYLLHAVDSGAVVRDSVLGPARVGSLAGRSALALTVRPASAAQQLSRGDRATLLISQASGSGDASPGLVVRDVPVLDRAVQGDSVATLVVAVPDPLLAELAARLGTSTVHVLPSTIR